MGGLIAAAVCVVILIGAALRGYSIGFLRTAFSMLILVISIFLMSMLSPYVNEALSRTAIPRMIYNTIYSNMQDKAELLISGQAASSDQSADADQLKQISLTTDEQKSWMTAGNIPQWVQQQVCSGEEYAADVLIDRVSQYLSDYLVNVISYVLTFILMYAMMHMISMFLGIINYIPILRGINRTLGAVLGLVQGLFVLWILALLITIFAPSEWGGNMIAAIESNSITGILYHTLLTLGR